MSRRTSIVAASLLGLLAAALRIPYLGLPFQLQDEGYYAATAREWLGGKALYSDLSFQRPPLLGAVYGSALKAGGVLGLPYDLSLRVLACVWSGLAVALVAYLLLTRLDVISASVGSLLMALGSASLTLQNEANSETWMLLPYAASGVVVIAVAEDGESPRASLLMLAAGVLTGVAVLFKEVAAVNLALPVLAWLVFDPKEIRRWLKHALAFWGGALSTLLLAVAGLAAIGDARDFFYSTWVTRAIYSASSDLRAEGLSLLLRRAEQFQWALTWTIAAAAVLFVFAWIWARGARREWRLSVFGAAWLAISFVGVAASGRYYPHYFIQILPALTITVAGSLACLRAQAAVGRRWLAVGATVLSALVLSIAAVGTVQDFQSLPAAEDRRAQVVSIAAAIDTFTPRGETYFLWGHVVAPRAYADAPARTDVVWSYYPLGEAGGRTWGGRHYPSEADKMLEGLTNDPPYTIVLTANIRPGDQLVESPYGQSTLDLPDDERVPETLQALLAEEYRLRQLDERYAVFVRK